MLNNDDLRSYSLFGGLDDNALNLVRELVRVDDTDTGDAVLIQGESGDRVHCILSGRAWVYSDGEHIATLGPGQQFGEMHLVDVQHRSASVIAATSLRTISLGSADLMQLQRHHSDAAIMILLNCARDVSRRLRRMNQRYVDAVRELEDLRAQRAVGQGSHEIPIGGPCF